MDVRPKICRACKRPLVQPDLAIMPRHVQILDFLTDYRRKHGYAPTYDEIAAHIKRSKVCVWEHLRNMVIRGLITIERSKARSIRVVTSSRRAGARQ